MYPILKKIVGPSPIFERYYPLSGWDSAPRSSGPIKLSNLITPLNVVDWEGRQRAIRFIQYRHAWNIHMLALLQVEPKFDIKDASSIEDLYSRLRESGIQPLDFEPWGKMLMSPKFEYWLEDTPEVLEFDGTTYKTVSAVLDYFVGQTGGHVCSDFLYAVLYMPIEPLVKCVLISECHLSSVISNRLANSKGKVTAEKKRKTNQKNKRKNATNGKKSRRS